MFRIFRGSWRMPQIFDRIRRAGNISEREMFCCFNMGIGMVLTVDKNFVKTVISRVAKFGIGAWVIGEVTKGNGEIKIE
jgi:phosphoribosylformylglycinamidine cyclo-ligase